MATNLGLGWALMVLLSIPLAPAVSGAAGAQEPDITPQDRLVQEFQERVKNYMELHKKAAKQGPKLKETKDSAEIKAAQDALAARIRAARPNANRGNIFTPAIARHFRALMYPEMVGTAGANTKGAIQDVQPSGIPLKVNARYPEDQPRPMVPPNVLLRLPRLPEGLEYRIVHDDLILRDVNANLIVDFIPNAIQ